MERIYLCEMCNFNTVTIRHLNYHIVKWHRFCPNFKAKCQHCPFRTKSHNSFKTHMSRKHRQRNDVEFRRGIPDVEINDIGNVPQIDPEEELKKQCGNFVLRLMSKLNLPASAVDDILSGAANLLTFAKDMVGAGRIEDYLGELRTHKRRMTYVKNNHSYVEPHRVFMGSEWQRRKDKKTKEIKLVKVNNYGYISPVKDTITQFLSKRDVYNEVCSDHRSDNGLIQDFCDADYCRNNAYIQSHDKCLQILFNTDSLQICNAISSHKSHKIDVFFYQIVNVRPEFRSKWKNIHVYAICKSEFVQKYGYEDIMRDFIDTMLELYNGMTLQINGNQEVFYGMVLAIICDTPAAAAISGCKDSSILSKKICRSCVISNRQMQFKVKLSDLQARSHQIHVDRCLKLDTMAKDNKGRWQSRWGITSTSPFLRLPYIDIAFSFPHDVMHCVHECALSYAMALILQRGWDQKYFTLEYLNSKLNGFPYHYLDVENKPEMIKREHIFGSVKMKQTGAAIMHMSYYLPLILGEKFPIDDKFYKNFMLLVIFSVLVCSPYVTVDTAGQLQEIIESYLISFKKLFPTVQLRPTQHFLLHVPHQVEQLQ